jgi:hypothetical protein
VIPRWLWPLCGISFLSGCQSATPAGAKAEAPKPVWHVLTALPLFLGDGDIKATLAGESAMNPLLIRLGERRTLQPLDTASAAHLSAVRNIVAIQPGMLPAEELVAFDAWVRAGGQAIIMADPDLAWPLSFPLGDSRTPPPSTLLDPLLKHWGLVLEGFRASPKISTGTINGQNVALVNPGTWSVKGEACTLTDNRLVAHCHLGKGWVTLIGDADFADARLWKETGQDNLPVIETLFKLHEQGQQ